MISAVLIGDRQVVAAINRAPIATRARLLGAINKLALQLQAHVQLDKLSGQVLRHVTGKLMASIFHQVIEGGDKIVGRVYSAGDVKYAAIHEFGGIVHIPEMVPVKAKALHFFAGGKEVFAMRARAHDVTMPERSFLRSALTDMEKQIVAEMRQAILDGLRDAGLHP